ncbi:reticulon-4b isoform X1 [Hoplias malabaricus]|uniref:reticulon-4b isoform X1 n=1 Tax=Hoplias malabaricus TaxID=27720 RepID=UPI0034624983
MADAEVSSTTPNEVHEEFGEGVMNGSNNEAEAKEENTVLVSFAAHDETELREVMKGVETHTAFEPEPAKPEPLVTSSMEEPQTKESKKEQEEEIVQTADKAETELPEKLDLISSSEPSEVEESEWLEEQQVAAAVAAPVPVQEVKAPEKEAPTEATAAEKEAIPEQPEPEQKEEIVAAVPEHTAVVTSTPEPEEIRASPVEVVQKQEDFAVSESVVVKAEETFKSAPVEEEPAPAPLPPSSHEPSLPAPAAPLPPLMQFTSESGNSSLIASQDITKITMDSFGNDSPSRNPPRYEPDVLNQSDDDLMFEMKRNSFQDFSPVDHPSSEFSHFGETTADTRAAKMSDSPSPDLVQNAHEGELQDDLQDYESSFDSREAATESLRHQLASSDLFTTTSKEHEDVLPPSLPDILKSSPLNPDKVDSGSSEGSPDFSPVHRSGNDSPNAPFSLSANNPFAFETKVPLLKEMTEETEARAAAAATDMSNLEADSASEKIFGTFDLVKEAEVSPKGNETAIEDQDDFKSSSQDSVQMVDRFECLSFPTGKAQEHFDSESPSADSLSPVLEAMAKNPASFQIEQDKNFIKEEAEAADEVSEHEVSSEEFEFVEKPPRGAIDEFLETLDNSKFASKADDEDLLPKFAEKTAEKEADASPAAQETQNQSSYLLLTEPLDGASQARGKAGLELSDFQVPSQAPLAHVPVIKTETMTTKEAEPKAIKLPSLGAGTVVDLLYWRDVKNTGVVFGACLLLLLSLSVCSIISVLSYVALALLSVTVTFRIYKGILQAIQKSDEGHPFKQYLEQDVTLPEAVVHKYSDVALGRINSTIVELRRLFLVEDLVDSLKFAVLMWILTYVGAFFNGLTLLILGLVSAFTCPVVYEKHQTQIDHYIALVNNQIKDVVGKIQAKIPGAKKKAE